MYKTHFYCLDVEADGIFLNPVTFGGQCGGSMAWVPSIKMEMSRNYSVVPSRFGDASI